MSWDVSNFDNWTPEEIPAGFVALEGGKSKEYITGGWRSMRPVWDADACTSCMLCWIACPDSSVVVENKEMTGIDYDHCKGCGLCVKECRFGALEFITEAEAKEAE